TGRQDEGVRPAADAIRPRMAVRDGERAGGERDLARGTRRRGRLRPGGAEQHDDGRTNDDRGMHPAAFTPPRPAGEGFSHDARAARLERGAEIASGHRPRPTWSVALRRSDAVGRGRGNYGRYDASARRRTSVIATSIAASPGLSSPTSPGRASHA